MGNILARLKRIFWIKFTLDVFQRFGKDNGGLLAAGLAFFMVLAFVPMLLVGLWVLGHFYIHRPNEAVVQIEKLLTSRVLPGAAGIEIKHLMFRAGITAAENGPPVAGKTLLNILHKSGIGGLIGLLGLVWSAMQIFINGSVAMNAAWETTEKRGWLKLRLVALGLLVGVGVLVVLSIGATSVSTWAQHSQLTTDVPRRALLISIASEIGAIIASAVMFTAIFKYLPSARVSWKSALFGGAVTALAWEIAKKGLSLYLSHPNTSLYGDLGNLIIFVLIVYYSMMILLLGAEVSVEYAAEVENAGTAKLKKVAQARPAADTAVPSGSPLARAKERNRAERIRKTARKEGQQSRR
jgi:membrane protein